MALTFNQVKPATAPQEQAPAPKNDAGMANITIRVDADCYLLCDGEFMEDIQIVANQIIKAKLPVGQHILEFMDMENPDIKVEKAVDFSNEGKSYLVLVNDLTKAKTEFNQKQKSDNFLSSPPPLPTTPNMQLSQMQGWNSMTAANQVTMAQPLSFQSAGQTMVPPPLPQTPIGESISRDTEEEEEV